MQNLDLLILSSICFTQEKEIPSSAEFSLEKVLGDPV